MSDQVENYQAAARWVAATVCPLTLQASQAQAAVRDGGTSRAGCSEGGPFSGDEGGCPLSPEEVRILRRELGGFGVAGGVL